MAYTPTKTHYGIGLAIIIAIVLLIGWKYFGWFGGSKNQPKDGTPCTTSDGTAGVYTNGTCAGPGKPGNGGPSSERTRGSATGSNARM